MLPRIAATTQKVKAEKYKKLKSHRAKEMMRMEWVDNMHKVYMEKRAYSECCTEADLKTQKIRRIIII